MGVQMDKQSRADSKISKTHITLEFECLKTSFDWEKMNKTL
jgi:hypothetical protein